MAGNVFPGEFDRNAPEDRGQDIAAKIAKDKGYDCPGAVSEHFIHAKKTEVEKKDSDFVSK